MAKISTNDVFVNININRQERLGRLYFCGKKDMAKLKKPNKKVPHILKEIFADHTGEYFSGEEFKRDLDSLEPKDRLFIMERFAQYVVPKAKEEDTAVVQASIVSHLLSLK